MADASPATEVHDTPEPVLTSATAEDQAPPQVTEAALSGSPDKQKCSVGDQNACTTPDAASGTPAAEVASEPPQLPGSSPPAPQAASASKRKVFSGLMARLAKPKTRRGPNDSEPGGALKPNRISGSGSASMQVTPAGAAAAAVAAAWTQAEPLGHLKQEKVIEPFKLAGGGTIVTENDLKTEVSDDTKAGSAYLDPLVGEKGDSHVKTKSHPQGPETLDLPAESKDLELEAKEEETDKYECAGDEEDTESRPADNLPAVSLPERQTQRRRVPSAIAKAAAETEAEFFASRGRGKGRGSRGSRHSGVASARRGGRGRARGRGAGSESGKTTPATPSPRVVSELARPDLSASIEHDGPGQYDDSKSCRKPYSATKQREVWSSEEHERFIEAVEKFGRKWKSVAEHLSKEGCQSDIPPPRRKRRTSEGIKSGRTTAKTSAISHEAGPPRGAMAGIDPSAEHELSPGHPEADSDADTRETPSSSAPGVGPKAGMKGGESFSQASMPNTSFPDTLHPGQGVGSPRESIGRQWDNQQKQGDLKVNVDQDTSWQRNPPDSIMQRQQMGMMGDGQEEGNQMMDFDQGSMMTQQRVNGRGEIGGVGPSYPMQVSSGGLSNSWNFDHQRGMQHEFGSSGGNWGMDRMSPDGIVDDVDQGSMEAGSGQYVLQMGIRSMDQASSGMSNNSGMSWQQQRRPMQHITGFYGDFDPPGMLQQQQQYSRSGCFNVMQDMVMMSGSFEGDVPGVQIPSGPRFWPNGGGGADARPVSDMGMPPSMYPQSHVEMGIGMGMGIREHINGRQNEMIPGYYNGGGMVDSGFMPDSDQSPIMEAETVYDGSPAMSAQDGRGLMHSSGMGGMGGYGMPTDQEWRGEMGYFQAGDSQRGMTSGGQGMYLQGPMQEGPPTCQRLPGIASQMQQPGWLGGAMDPTLMDYGMNCM